MASFWSNPGPVEISRLQSPVNSDIYTTNMSLREAQTGLMMVFQQLTTFKIIIVPGYTHLAIISTI